MSKRIMTSDGIDSMTINTEKQAFKIFYSIKPE